MSQVVEFHTELQLIAERMFHSFGWDVIREYRLPSGRIADLICLDHEYNIHICEIKTALSDSIIGAAQMKYQYYCNYLYIGAPIPEIAKILQEMNTLNWAKASKALGYVNLSPKGGFIARPPSRNTLQRKGEVYLTWAIRKQIDAANNVLGTTTKPT